MSPLSVALIKTIFVLVLGTASLIVMLKTLSSLFLMYGAQSLLIAAIALILFVETGSSVLLALAILTVAIKVIVIPYMLNRIRKDSATTRDVEFRYLTPVSTILISIILVFIVYISFDRVFRPTEDRLFFLGAVIGVSLTLLGMMVVFSRKKIVTKTVGYLAMENGILLFGVFMAELPLIIEMLIIVDLIIFVLLATILAFGINSTEAAFSRKLNKIANWFRE
jgi:hydrogenase-4 component E